MRARARSAIVLLLILYIGGVTWRFIDKKHYIWFGDFVRWEFTPAPPVEGPRHLLVFYTDHFEPASHLNRVQRWETDFPRLALKHRDHEGRPQQHTWFYPAEQPIDANLEGLQRLVAGGFGEVEVHLHHGNDTYQTLERKLQDGLTYFQRFGFARTIDGKTSWGFVHGNFALDNADGRASRCGVNEELTLLRANGAYADFSFPAVWNTSQPKFVNVIYEAQDDPQPKSYDRQFPFQARPSDRLPIFTGPLTAYLTLDPLRAFYKVEDANVHPTVPMTPERVDQWVRANIHVPGRPEWVFIKMWGHAASSDEEVADNVPGGTFERALERLEQHYNDGHSYVLHYVTAREAYNVARAAAAGRSGDPTQYYDYEVKPYVADPRLDLLDAKAGNGAPVKTVRSVDALARHLPS
jgi:hypothetical protein